MKKIFAICLCALVFGGNASAAEIFPLPTFGSPASLMPYAGAVNSAGYFKGIRLAGKVKIVTSFGDIKVQVVNSFPDLKVKVVERFPNKIGEWQFVESFPDFTIQYVDSFPDIKIQFVENFPGVGK